MDEKFSKKVEPYKIILTFSVILRFIMEAACFDFKND